MKKKIIISLLSVAILAVAGIWFYFFVWGKYHHRDVSTESAITVTAKDIVKSYQANEPESNKKFLNKAVEIIGEVVESKKEADGKISVTLKSDDSFSSVFCILSDSTQAPLKPGATSTIKGRCIGFTSDVRVDDAIIKD